MAEQAVSFGETHLVSYKRDRTSDYQYQNLLKGIQTEGEPAISGMDDNSVELLNRTMEFDLENGFPLITERDLMRGTRPDIIAGYESDTRRRLIVGPARQALGEIIGFINGAHTQEQLAEYGCTTFWLPWTTNEAKAKKRGLEVGDLGPGSYGPAFHDFPTADGGKFDQYEAMIAQIEDRPELRTHIITPFIPEYLSRAPGHEQKTLIVPCHGMQHFNINVAKKEISLVHGQRAADAPLGLPFNMAHYAAALMMVGQVTGYTPRKLYFSMSNAHIYGRHDEIVDEIVSRQPFPFPKVEINPDVKNIEDFRIGDFAISEYFAHPPIAMGGAAV
jgi:thymidylate synthase